MKNINQLIIQIQEDIKNSKFNQFTKENEEKKKIFPNSNNSLIAYNLPIDIYIDYFKKNYNEINIDSFYKDSNISINHVLSEIIKVCLNKENNMYILIKEKFINLINYLLSDIKIGKTSYSITFRIINISIEEDIILQDNGTEKIYLHKIENSQVQQKYPKDDYVNKLFTLDLWVKHNTEFIIEKKGTLKDITEDSCIEGTNRLENILINTFLLSGFGNPHPYASHSIINSLYKYTRTSENIGSFQLMPKEISSTQAQNLIKAYNVIQEINNDNILESAFDRFLIALKQDNQHPNKINTPNWDKIVDFAIAFETLFLTVNSNALKSELSYRFQLNGSSLLSEVVATEKRNLFKALNKLYSIRSNIVHGGKEKDLIKLIDEFLKILNIDDSTNKHSIGKLILITKQLEEWLKLIFYHLSDIEIKNRPYNKEGAWEDYLWS